MMPFSMERFTKFFPQIEFLPSLIGKKFRLELVMKDRQVQIFAVIVFLINLFLAIVGFFVISIFKHVFFMVSCLAMMIGFLIYVVANYIQSRNNKK